MTTTSNPNTRMFSRARGLHERRGYVEEKEKEEGGVRGVEGLCFHLL
jgi:hypothetical protein